jgi:hypothetical protein
MDKLTHYRQILTRLIREYASYRPSHGQIDTEAVIDPDTDQDEVLHVGWDGVRRVHGSVVHVDIHDGKLWVQYDGTTRPIAEELAAAGIPKQDIILAFHPAELRPHTGYGVS